MSIRGVFLGENADQPKFVELSQDLLKSNALELRRILAGKPEAKGDELPDFELGALNNKNGNWLVGLLIISKEMRFNALASATVRKGDLYGNVLVFADGTNEERMGVKSPPNVVNISEQEWKEYAEGSMITQLLDVMM